MNIIIYTSDNVHFVDISELNLPKSCTISFPNGKDDLMTFEVTIKPDEGYYMYVIASTHLYNNGSNELNMLKCIKLEFLLLM